MKILIAFSEIQSLVNSKTRRELVLSAVDERTVKVETKVKVKVPLLGEISKTVGVEVSVEKIEDSDIQLKYDGGLGTDMIIGGLLMFLASTPAMKMVEKTPGHGILVHLGEIDEAKKDLDMMELTGIAFNDNAVDIEGKLKVC